MDELIKRLRELHPEEFGNEWDFAFAVQQAMHEAADAIEELSMKLHGANAAVDGMQREIERMVVYGNKPQWIPVTERLPDYDEDVLVYANGLLRVWDRIKTRDDVDYWENEYGYWVDFNDVDYWMPLPPSPEPPKEET